MNFIFPIKRITFNNDIFRNSYEPVPVADVARTKKNEKRTEGTERKARTTDEKEERHEERNTNGNKRVPDYRQC